MLLMNISGLDGSTSIINERVQIELEQILDDYEELKIQHERTKREEFKVLEADRLNEKRKLKELAERDVEIIRRQMERSQT